MKIDDIKQIVDSAIRVCLPDQAVKRALDKLPDNQGKRILIAIGKAAYRMAQAAIDGGFGGYIVMKLLKAKNPGVGWAIGTTAGNAVGTPAALLALGVITDAVSTSATGQITAAIIVTAILAPLFTDFFSKKHIKKNPQAVETV